MIICPQPQRGSYDCAIASLATILALPYRNMAGIADRVLGSRSWRRVGLWTKDIERLLRVAQRRYVVRVHKWPSARMLKSGTGLLEIRQISLRSKASIVRGVSRRPSKSHCVVLFHGLVYDPTDNVLTGWRDLVRACEDRRDTFAGVATFLELRRAK